MYCARLGLSTGHLIYAAGEPRPEPFDLVGTDVSVVIHAIDITRSMPEIDAQVAELAQAVLTSAATQPVGSQLEAGCVASQQRVVRGPDPRATADRSGRSAICCARPGGARQTRAAGPHLERRGSRAGSVREWTAAAHVTGSPRAR